MCLVQPERGICLPDLIRVAVFHQTLHFTVRLCFCTWVCPHLSKHNQVNSLTFTGVNLSHSITQCYVALPCVTGRILRYYKPVGQNSPPQANSFHFNQGQFHTQASSEDFLKLSFHCVLLFL